jgi:hypothetical protein
VEEPPVITTPLMAIIGGLHYGEEMGRGKEEVVAVSVAGEAKGTRASSGRGTGRCTGGSWWCARCGGGSTIGRRKKGLMGGPRLALREGGRKGWRGGWLGPGGPKQPCG